MGGPLRTIQGGMNCCFVIPWSRGCNSIASLEGVMKSRNIGAGLLVLASSMFLLVGSASAHTTAPASPSENTTCVVHSLPGGFVAQGEFSTAATVADVVEVECNPAIYGTGSKMKITAS